MLYVQGSEIFVLPEEYEHLHSTVVDMFVSSVKPVDSDRMWCMKADAMIKEKLKFANNFNDTIIVKVRYLLL